MRAFTLVSTFASARSGRVGCARARQRGAVSAMAVMLMATIGVAALVSIDIGYVFYGQRQLQKMADLAAVSGAQQLKRAADLATTSASVLAAVQGTAAQNGYTPAVTTSCGDVASGAADGMRTCLGLWDPGNPANGDSKRHFNAGYNPATVSPNAVRVQATMTLPVLFVFPGSSGRQLRAEAIAAGSPPVASFSLGSGLVDVNTANGLLGALLGPNVVVKFSAADWSGLVGSQISLEQLRIAAGVGTIDQLLGLQLSLRDFYALVLKAANRDALLSTALGTPATTLGVGGVGAAVSLAKLLDLGVLAPAASSAAEVGLNVASLIALAAQIARGDSSVALTLPTLNVPGILSASSRLLVIEPPQVAVGPVRQTSGSTQWITTASTGQLGVDVNVQATTIKLGALVDVSVQLPLRVRAATATADLTGLQCAADATQRRATIDLAPRVADLCIADPDGGKGCAAVGKPVTLGSVNVLGIPLAALTGYVNTVSGATPTKSSVTLAPGGTQTMQAPIPVATLVKGLLDSLELNLAVLSLPLPVVKTDILSPLLAPVGSLLDQLLSATLPALGIRLGNADLWMNGIDCNNAELVY